MNPSTAFVLWQPRQRPLTFALTSHSKLARLEQLEELDLSGNRLRSVPTTILCCQRLHTLSAHSNCIGTFPEVLQLPEIKVSLTHTHTHTHRSGAEDCVSSSVHRSELQRAD